MPNVTFVSPDGTSKTVDCPVGTSIMKCGLNHGITGIYAQCGGQQMCATCHVYVAEDSMDVMSEMTAEEDEMLEATACDRLANSRLSCALVMGPEHENLVVHLPESQL